MSTTTDNGFRSRCCYAPIRLGRKKIKKTEITVNIWICCNCGKRDTDIVQYTKTGPPASTGPFAKEVVDRQDESAL